METIENGLGELFMDPDPDKARQYYRQKSRKITNKLTNLKDAVGKFVQDGDYLAIGGFGSNRTPMAACHEIVRQGRKNMGFAGHTATHDMEVLAAGEVFNRLDVAYVVGLEARGLSPNARKYLESGKVAITEWTNYALSARLRAAAMGVPFLPLRSTLGTDTFKYSAAKMVKCPFTDKKLALMPALYPDVAIIHVHEADVFGNARFRGISVADLELASAAKKLIITTEKLISIEEIRSDPHLTRIPYYLVDAVVDCPFGAYPGTMPYMYFSDEAHLREWMAVEKDPEKFQEFIKRNIYDCKTHEEYINLNGGLEKLKELRAKELLLDKEE